MDNDDDEGRLHNAGERVMLADADILPFISLLTRSEDAIQPCAEDGVVGVDGVRPASFGADMPGVFGATDCWRGVATGVTCCRQDMGLMTDLPETQEDVDVLIHANPPADRHHGWQSMPTLCQACSASTHDRKIIGHIFRSGSTLNYWGVAGFT